jgi:flagellar biosynthetic protein FlhB
MAAADAEERTESATPKRLEEARRRGQIPRSRDLSTAAVMMTGAAGLYYLGGTLGAELIEMIRRSLLLSRVQALDAAQIVPALASAFGAGLLACVPLFGLIALAALLAPLALGGWSFSTAALMPQFNRLNPLSGLKRMFSMQSLVELLKALAKFGVVGIVAYLVLRNAISEILGLGQEPLRLAIAHSMQLAGYGLLAVSAGLLLIAGVDVPFQLWQYAKQMRMTRQEVRQEMRESEGSPEIKGRIRQVQQELARRRMMQEVPKADVIITNPTHFAVALRYDDQRMRAPRVVAKGVDEIAARIREIGAEHAVPLFEAPPLARVLYRNVELGEEVPSALYVAVAQVLGYIFQLRTAERTGGQRPLRPQVEVDEGRPPS